MTPEERQRLRSWNPTGPDKGGEGRRWKINVCPWCEKLLSTWPPDEECRCEPVAIGHSPEHLRIEVTPVGAASQGQLTGEERLSEGAAGKRGVEPLDGPLAESLDWDKLTDEAVPVLVEVFGCDEATAWNALYPPNGALGPVLRSLAGRPGGGR